jgi:hypothetical protein
MNRQQKGDVSEQQHMDTHDDHDDDDDDDDDNCGEEYCLALSVLPVMERYLSTASATKVSVDTKT